MLVTFNKIKKLCFQHSLGNVSKLMFPSLRLKIKKIFPHLLLVGAFLLVGQGCKIQSQALKDATKPIKLNYWRVFDGPAAFSQLIADYQTAHPNVTINYRQLRSDEYEKELVNALAEDRGPDIFSVHQMDLNAYKAKIAPLPTALTLSVVETKGTIKKEQITSLKKFSTISLKSVRDKFTDQIFQDVVLLDELGNGRVYGLPLAMDTLALFVNRDILNAAGIPSAPTTWDEFQAAVKKIAKVDKNGKITQAAASLGLAKNVERAGDIALLLMMQNGATIANEIGRVVFNEIPEALRFRRANPAADALRFYTDFANPDKEVYTWNKDMPNSLEAFAMGKTAFFFGYAYHLPTVKARAPKLNLAIVKVPQIAGNPEINFANYWVESVSKKSKYQDTAWDFVQFMTTDERVKSYLVVAKKPAALRSLLKGQFDDLDLGAFAAEVLTAKTWYRGLDSKVSEEALSAMIEAVANAGQTAEEAIDFAVRQINQTIR